MIPNQKVNYLFSIPNVKLEKKSWNKSVKNNIMIT